MKQLPNLSWASHTSIGTPNSRWFLTSQKNLFKILIRNPNYQNLGLPVLLKHLFLRWSILWQDPPIWDLVMRSDACCPLMAKSNWGATATHETSALWPWHPSPSWSDGKTWIGTLEMHRKEAMKIRKVQSANCQQKKPKCNSTLVWRRECTYQYSCLIHCWLMYTFMIACLSSNFERADERIVYRLNVENSTVKAVSDVSPYLSVPYHT